MHALESVRNDGVTPAPASSSSSGEAGLDIGTLAAREALGFVYGTVGVGCGEVGSALSRVIPKGGRRGRLRT